MALHPLTQKLQALLKKENCWFETFVHQPVRTSEEAAKVRNGYTLHQGAKALIIKVRPISGQEKFVMLVLPGDLRLDNKKLKTALSVKDLRFATPKEVELVAQGVIPGGVPPFGNLFGIEVLVDTKLLDCEKIIFNAGDRSFSIAMKLADYQRLVKPLVAELT